MLRAIALGGALILLIAVGWRIAGIVHSDSTSAPDPVSISPLPATNPEPEESDMRVALPAQADPRAVAEREVAAVPVAAVGAGTALAAHGLTDPQQCLAATGKDVRAQRVEVHRWVDANGILHFSDKPPSGEARDYARSEVTGLPAVTVRARGEDSNLPTHAEQRAIADALAIERVLRDALGVEGEPGLALDIVFIASADIYARRVGNPALAGSVGAYSSRERTIFVRRQHSAEADFAVLRHEIAHALLHERVGMLPVAINEGLAGFLERLVVTGMGAQVAAADPRVLASARVAGDGSDELVDLLAREGQQFYAEGREVRYLRAYALIALLMERREGRAALSALLLAQRADSCRPVDAAAFLAAGWPGGLPALARDWGEWLRNPPASVQAY